MVEGLAAKPVVQTLRTTMLLARSDSLARTAVVSHRTADLKGVAEVVRKPFGKSYHSDHVRWIMCNMPHHRLAGREPEYRWAFRA